MVLHKGLSVRPFPEAPSADLLSRGQLIKTARHFVCKGLFRSCGRNVVIESKAHIPFHKVEIGDNSGIRYNARLGAVKIGNDVMMGPDVIVLSGNHVFKSSLLPMRLQGATGDNPPMIADDVWIGTRAIILPGVHIGKGVIIGSGAVVAGGVAEYSIVVGNPARVVKKRA